VKYAEFQARDHFTAEELLAFGHGRLIEDPPPGFRARLPLPPMLMLDRILEIRRSGNRGRIVAEQDVRLDAWFFQCHFSGDPVQPGCLGLDAVWQLVGFFCVHSGGLGSGRALGVGEVEFAGQIRPRDSVVRHEIDVVRFSRVGATGAAIAIADARVLVDGDLIYTIHRAKAGTFPEIDYADYPLASPRSRGGRIDR
jgi:3-hydroxyacyl-[acyl-carrier protein] dehydratase / trans-2-decenoyl-[acyl-carrier protein] isomerase